MEKDTQLREVGNDLTEGKILPKLVRFVLPLLLANIVQQLYNTVDMAIIGHYVGSIGTVGVSAGGNIASFLTMVASGFAGAAQIYISQLSGSKDKTSIAETVSTILTFMLVIAAALAAISLIFCRTFLLWLNCPKDAFQQAVGYMLIVSLGYPFIFGYNAICGIMRGVGESKKPLYFITVAAISNVFMDLLLVAVIPLEAIGTAIATVIAQMVSFIAAIRFVLKNESKFQFKLNLSSFRIHKKHLNIILKTGIPLVAQSAFIQFSQLFCISYINGFGLTASATNSIGEKIQRLINIFMTSITQGTGAMLGQNIGAQKHERVPKIVYTALGCSLLCATFSSAISVFAPHIAFSVFTNDPEVIEFGVIYLRICVILYYLSAIQGCFQSVTTGCGNTKLNLISGILDGIVLRIGISFLLAYRFEMGVIGFFYGNALARIAPVIIHYLFFRSNKWREFKLLDKQ